MRARFGKQCRFRFSRSRRRVHETLITCFMANNKEIRSKVLRSFIHSNERTKVNYLLRTYMTNERTKQGTYVRTFERTNEGTYMKISYCRHQIIKSTLGTDIRRRIMVVAHHARAETQDGRITTHRDGENRSV